MSAGELRNPQRAMGTMPSQTVTPAAAQAMRQSNHAIATPGTIGANDIRPSPTALLNPIATPRYRSNHNATAVVEASVTDPWPSRRMPTNPAVNATRPRTPAIAARTTPKKAPMIAMTLRTPARSIQRPTDGSAAAPASVPVK